MPTKRRVIVLQLLIFGDRLYLTLWILLISVLSPGREDTLTGTCFIWLRTKVHIGPNYVGDDNNSGKKASHTAMDSPRRALRAVSCVTQSGNFDVFTIMTIYDGFNATYYFGKITDNTYWEKCVQDLLVHYASLLGVVQILHLYDANRFCMEAGLRKSRKSNIHVLIFSNDAFLPTLYAQLSLSVLQLHQLEWTDVAKAIRIG